MRIPFTLTKKQRKAADRQKKEFQLCFPNGGRYKYPLEVYEKMQTLQKNIK